MKTGEDFRREFPLTDESFQDAAYRALSGLHERQAERRMRFRPVMLIAVLLVLLTGVSVAATWERWSLNSFITPYRITATEEEWSQMLADFSPVAVQGSVADMTIREAVYDGLALYMVVDVAPHDTNLFLIPFSNADLDAPACETVSDFPEDVTLRQHIAALGYTSVGKVDIYSGLLDVISFVPEMAMNEDGTFTFYLRQRRKSVHPDEREQIALNISVSIRPMNGGSATFMEGEALLKTQPVLESAVSPAGESHLFENHGVRMTNVRLYRTILSAYLTADVEIVDRKAYDAHFLQYVLNQMVGEQHIAGGPFNLSGIMEETKRGEYTGIYTYTATMVIDELPEELTISENSFGSRLTDTETDRWTFRLVEME